MTEQVTNLDADALKYVLSLPRGRKVIWGLLGLAGLFRQPFNQDLRQTDFNCGSLNLALALYADCLQVSPELTAMMTQEQANVDRTELERKRSDDSGSSSAGPSASSSPGSSATDLGDDSYFDRFGLGRVPGEIRDD